MPEMLVVSFFDNSGYTSVEVKLLQIIILSYEIYLFNVNLGD